MKIDKLLLEKIIFEEINVYLNEGGPKKGGLIRRIGARIEGSKRYAGLGKNVSTIWDNIERMNKASRYGVASAQLEEFSRKTHLALQSVKEKARKLLNNITQGIDPLTKQRITMWPFRPKATAELTPRNQMVFKKDEIAVKVWREQFMPEFNKIINHLEIIINKRNKHYEDIIKVINKQLDRYTKGRTWVEKARVEKQLYYATKSEFLKKAKALKLQNAQELEELQKIKKDLLDIKSIKDGNRVVAFLEGFVTGKVRTLPSVSPAKIKVKKPPTKKGEGGGKKGGGGGKKGGGDIGLTKKFGAWAGRAGIGIALQYGSWKVVDYCKKKDGGCPWWSAPAAVLVHGAGWVATGLPGLLGWAGMGLFKGWSWWVRYVRRSEKIEGAPSGKEAADDLGLSSEKFKKSLELPLPAQNKTVKFVTKSFWLHMFLEKNKQKQQDIIKGIKSTFSGALVEVYEEGGISHLIKQEGCIENANILINHLKDQANQIFSLKSPAERKRHWKKVQAKLQLIAKESIEYRLEMLKDFLEQDHKDGFYWPRGGAKEGEKTCDYLVRVVREVGDTMQKRGGAGKPLGRPRPKDSKAALEHDMVVALILDLCNKFKSSGPTSSPDARAAILAGASIDWEGTVEKFNKPGLQHRYAKKMEETVINWYFGNFDKMGEFAQYMEKAMKTNIKKTAKAFKDAIPKKPIVARSDIPGNEKALGRVGDEIQKIINPE